MATTSAERQRKRRARLRADGFVDVTVTVPKDKAAAVRRFARGEMPAVQDRLAIVLRALRDNQSKLEELGVIHAGVFGSTARGDYRPDSDVDVLIDINVEKVRDVLGLVRIGRDIKGAVNQTLPSVDVEVADLGALKSGIRKEVEGEAVYAF